MCQPRVWNKLYSEEIERDKDNILLSLIAERSDYEIFKVIVKLPKEISLLEASSKFKKAFETLETYRNCDCTIISGECIKHTSKIITDLIPKTKTISSFSFGRK